MTPAARLIQIGGITRAIASPNTTAIADVATSAKAEPANTTQREAPDADMLKVASWVLSPISAMNIAPKVVRNSFQSMETWYPIGADSGKVHGCTLDTGAGTA